MYNKDLIGKFFKIKGYFGDKNMLAFRVITGYDYLRDVYITTNVNSEYNSYEALVFSEKLMPELFTADEAEKMISEQMEQESKKLNILLLPIEELMGRELRENERNEFYSLFRSYKEVLWQIDIYRNYASEAERCHDSLTALMYEKYVQQTKKAQKRLEKRFYYYFKKEAKNVQEIMHTYDEFADIKTTQKRVSERIQKYERQQEKISKIKNAISKENL